MAIDTVLELQVVMNCRLWIRDSRKVFVLFVEMERDVAILGGVCERDFVLCVRGLNAFNTMKTRSKTDGVLVENAVVVFSIMRELGLRYDRACLI